MKFCEKNVLCEKGDKITRFDGTLYSPISLFAWISYLLISLFPCISLPYISLLLCLPCIRLDLSLPGSLFSCISVPLYISLSRYLTFSVSSLY
jgi:hypothetical protein